MYNLIKNKYLIYIISYMNISSILFFKKAINNALNHISGTIKGTHIIYSKEGKEDTEDTEVNIINKFIEKLIEFKKKPLSITKYNYNYYLNDCDEKKEQMLFNKIFIDIIIYYPPDFTNENNIKLIIKLLTLLIQNIKEIYKIYKKFKYNTNFDFLITIATSLNSTPDYNVDNNEHIKLLLKLSNIDYRYNNKKLTITNSSVNFLILFYLAFNNDIVYGDRDNIINKLYKLYSLLLLNKNIEKDTDLHGIFYEITHRYKYDKDDIYIININDEYYNNSFKNWLSNKNYLIQALIYFGPNEPCINNLTKAIEDTFKPKEYEYLIINKDKQIIDLLKEFPEIEENYNIDNNSIVLYELSKKNINLNDTNYELFGYIAYNKYIKVNTDSVETAAVDVVGVAGGADGGDGGGDGDGPVAGADPSAGPGAAAPVAVGAGSDAAPVAVGDLSQLSNAKLLIYRKKEIENNYSKDPQKIIQKTKEECKKNKINLKEDSICENIELKWKEYSCYMDTLFVALFNKKHKFMDDLLYNLEINTQTNKKNVDTNAIYYNTLKIKEELINLYENISNKKTNKITPIYCSINLRKMLQYCYINKHTNIYDEINFETNGNSSINLVNLLKSIFKLDWNNLQIVQNIEDYNIVNNNPYLILLTMAVKITDIDKYISYFKSKKLNSIIIADETHYKCLFKCYDEWYEYNDINAVKVIKISNNDTDLKQYLDSAIYANFNIEGLYYI